MQWNVPTYRIRAYLRRKREAPAAAGPTSIPTLGLHLKKSTAEIRLSPGLSLVSDSIPATVLLNDLTQRGVFLFSSQALEVGQRIALVIHGPKPLYVSGRVALCKRMEVLSPVFGERSYRFRIGVVFEFRNIDERFAVKRYAEELANDYLKSASC